MTPEQAREFIAEWLSRDGEDGIDERAAVLAGVMDQRGTDCALEAIWYIEDQVEAEGQEAARELAEVLDTVEPGKAVEAVSERIHMRSRA